MKPVITAILIIVLLAVGWQLCRLFMQSLALHNEASETSAELANILAENATLQADLEYFSDYDNLAKELRGKMNYKSPGEKLIIIVPPKNEE